MKSPCHGGKITCCYLSSSSLSEFNGRRDYFLTGSLCFLHAGQEKKYEVRKRRVLRGKSVPHYAAVEPQGKGLMVASEKPFVFTHVDGRPVEQPQPEPMEVEKTGGSQGLMGNLPICCWRYFTVFRDYLPNPSSPDPPEGF